ncbi:hypothetical protein EJ03DRAFT_163415 [Teratosphaeria nubilosa]|uniref:Uncharacterized protein n=1 Tax=Teratosphaeria nubilosa TaxID=161662 RepID=A0A6G1L394_9PEZI|nr:hypothetical protein EJ03DRAFT_163415 [Teratosphaeria nubilosa]
MNMAADTALPTVLSSFTSATDAAITGLPEASSLLPPDNGITLLDAKNDIFLAYLQALALRNLNVIRGIKDGGDAQSFNDALTKKLVEHRVYLERGVRPLEQKIKYQVDKVVQAAEDEERATAQKAAINKKVNGRAKEGTDDEDSDAGDADSDEEAAALAHRPNAAAFARTTADDSTADRRANSKHDGVYRPPRISATAMPTPECRDRKEREQRLGRSATVDEYITTELAIAPVAEPSIGSTITAGGRKTKNAKDLQKEAERREYEETNLVRLPAASKKEKGRQGARDRGAGLGGEEWKGLGESVDRIGELTRRKGRDSALDKSRKRTSRAVEDGPRGSGMGDAFEVKRRRLAKKMRR